MNRQTKDDEMERIEIRLGMLAEYAATPLRSRDRKAAEIRQRLETPYEPKMDYWKKPREAIRSHVAEGRVDQLQGIEFESTEPSRVSNYARAVQEFLSWWNAFQPTSARTPKAQVVTLEALDVSVNPDLVVSVRGMKYVVRVRFNKSMELIRPERIVTMSLLSEAFPKSIPGILDLATGEFTSRAGSDLEMLEKEAADLVSRWPRD